MSWDDLRFFRALAQGGSLAAAARQLGVGVGTVHRRVAALEASMGARLFVRTRAGHALTDEGQIMLGRSDQISQLLADARHQIGDRDRGLRGTVRITTTQSAADFILLPRLALLRASHPQISIELEALPEIVSLVDERPSLALRFRRPERGDVTVRRLGNLSCSLFATRALLDDVGWTKSADVAHLPHIGWTRRFRDIGLARVLAKTFAHDPVVSLGSINGHLVAASSGLGVAHLPRFVASQATTLVDLLPQSESMSLAAWLVIPASLRHFARIDVVATFVKEAVAAAA